jgi:HEAT repeat protein
VVDEALNELMFLRHVKTITGLEEFVCGGAAGNLGAAKKAIQVLAAIDVDEALESLATLMRNHNLDLAVRRAALHALSSNRSSEAVDLLKEFAKTGGPLADQASSALKKAAGAK